MIIKTRVHFFVVLMLVGILCLPLFPTKAQENDFIESFDDPALSGWDRSPGVSQVDGVMYIEPGHFAGRQGIWGDMHLSARLRWRGEGEIVFSYGISESGGYHLLISREYLVMQRDSDGLLTELAANTRISIPFDEWSQIELLILEKEQRILVNGVLFLESFDESPLPQGGIAFETLGDITLEIDELVLIPAGEAPPPEPETAPSTSSVAEAQPQPSGKLTWVRTGGPPGGLGYDIRYNFDNPDIWYVTDAFAGVHISIDNGKTWKPSNQGIPKQAGATGDGIPVFCLTVDPHNPQIIWAGTDRTGHIYRSTDGGQTWEQRDNGVTIQYDALTFRGFTIDPRSSDIVYAMGETSSEAGGGPAVWGLGTGGVVYKTTNAGENWQVIWDGGMPSSLTRYMWINPHNPDILFVSTGLFDRGAVGEGDPETDPLGGLGILKSLDGGETWQIQNEANGLDMLYLSSLFMHPEDSDTLLVTAGHTTEARIGFFEMYAAEHGHSISGVFRTEDGGNHWERVLSGNNSAEAFAAVEMCPSDPNISYVASDIAVYRSQDAGKNWTQMTPGENTWGPSGVIAGFPIDIQCDPRDPDRLFINNYSGGNFLSEDGGHTWVNASQGYTGALLRAVAVDPHDPARVFAVGRNGAWRSDDGGNSWYGLTYPPPEFAMSFEQGTISIDPGNPEHLLLGDMPGTAILETFDGGVSWNLRVTSISLELGDASKGVTRSGRLAGLIPSNFVFAPSNPSIVYASLTRDFCHRTHEPCTELTGEGVTPIVSQDGGATWKSVVGEIPGRPEVIDIAVAPDDEKVLYAATWTGLYHSSDGGASWTMLSGLPDDAPVRAVAVNPVDSQHILAGLEQVGVYLSKDGGQTWQSGVVGFEPNGSLHDIVFDSMNSQIAYASDQLSGVYRSTDGGANWMKINDGLRTRVALGLGISSDGKHLYVATDGEGVFRLDLDGQPPDSAAPTPTQPVSDSAKSPTASLPCMGGFVPLTFLGMALVWRRRM